MGVILPPGMRQPSSFLSGMHVDMQPVSSEAAADLRGEAAEVRLLADAIVMAGLTLSPPES